IAFNVGAFEVCRDEGTRLIGERPDYGQAYSWRAMAHLALGELAKAQADMATARALATMHAWDERCEALVAAQAGDNRIARATLDRYLERSKQEWVSPLMIGQLHQALGEYDAAFHWYERAYQVREHLLAVLHTDRSFRLSPPGAPPIASDPRWERL